MNGRVSVQRGLYWFEKWANRYLMKLNKEKCKVLHLWRSSAIYWNRLPEQLPCWQGRCNGVTQQTPGWVQAYRVLSLYTRETANWAALAEAWPLKKGSYSHLPSYSEVEPGTLCPVLDPSVQEGRGKKCKGSSGKQPRWWAVCSYPVRRGWRTYLVWCRGG